MMSQYKLALQLILLDPTSSAKNNYILVRMYHEKAIIGSSLLNVAKKSFDFNSSQFRKQLPNPKYAPATVPEARDPKMQMRALFNT